MTLPSGTVAILMTDVVGSSVLWDAGADQMEAALARLDHLVRETGAVRGGEVVQARGEGDSHFVVFRRASDAIRAACDLQRALSTGMRVRAAIHACELEPVRDDYRDISVNRTARLRSCGHAGQILVSRAAADLAADHLRDGHALRSLGEHRMRDWPERIEVFEVTGPGLDDDFPPIQTAPPHPAIMAVVILDGVGWSSRVAPMAERDLVASQRMLGAIYRRAFDEHDGRTISMQGDGCTAVLDDPLSAIAFADSALRAAQERGVGVRASIHVGPLALMGNDIAGRAVFVASKIGAAAGAGEILVTRTVADLVRGSGVSLTPSEASIEALGERWAVSLVDRELSDREGEAPAE